MRLRALIPPYGLLSLSRPLRRHGLLVSGHQIRADDPVIRMGSALRALSRKNFLAIFAGVLIAGVPLIAFNIWLGSLIERQGQDEVDTSARRAISSPKPGSGKLCARSTILPLCGVDSCRSDRRDLAAAGGLCTRRRSRKSRFSALTANRCAPIPVCRRANAKSSRRSLLAEPTGYSLDIILLGNGERVRAIAPQSRRRPQFDRGADAGGAVSAAWYPPMAGRSALTPAMTTRQAAS